MLTRAKRLEKIGEYYFSKKLEEVRLMKASGKDVINLGIGSPDFMPEASVIAATQKSLSSPTAHGYASYKGSPELRKAISEWYLKTFDVLSDPNKNVLPLLGSKEGILYLAMAFLNPGDGVLVPDPGYPSYTSVMNLVGAKIHRMDLIEKNHWLPDFDALEKSDLSGVKMMWVNYPNMPTGQPSTAELFERLIDFGRRKKILIVHDNPYSQVLNQTPPRSIFEADPKMEFSVELNSLSKSFNMAGWRIGMLLGREEIIQGALAVKSNVDTGMFTPVQHGAIQALSLSQEWHAERNQVYARRRTWVWKIFDELGVHYSKDQVGLFVWGRLPDSVSDAGTWVDQILLEALVFLVPGFVFGENGARYVRSSLCANEATLEEAFTRIQNWKKSKRSL